MLNAILIVFVCGYLAIALEHKIHINKAASALFIGIVCWVLFIFSINELVPLEAVPRWFQEEAGDHGTEHLRQSYMIDSALMHLTGETAGILFFLMGAMTIVELVDAHEGFAIITERIRARNKSSLLWVVGFFAFFFSSVLDNLTSTIVMISLLRKLVQDRHDRLMFSGLVVIAANAGGAWTVIGDVTTTMLWIKQKIGIIEVMYTLFLGSLVSMIVPLFGIARLLKGELEPVTVTKTVVADRGIKKWHQWLFLVLGLLSLLSVPVFKSVTHLPPYMGMMLSLGVLWIVSEIVGHTMDESTKSSTGVLSALKRVDMSSILFFLGILLAVGALDKSGALGSAASWLSKVVPNYDIVATLIGLLSAVVDNVPLVAASINMYSFDTNDPFWMMLAFCAGTGGSCLIIGSAAGVAAMGLERIDFLWYLRHITPWAVLGYFAGIATILLQRFVVNLF